MRDVGTAVGCELPVLVGGGGGAVEGAELRPPPPAPLLCVASARGLRCRRNAGIALAPAPTPPATTAAARPMAKPPVVALRAAPRLRVWLLAAWLAEGDPLMVRG